MSGYILSRFLIQSLPRLNQGAGQDGALIWGLGSFPKLPVCWQNSVLCSCFTGVPFFFPDCSQLEAVSLSCHVTLPYIGWTQHECFLKASRRLTSNHLGNNMFLNNKQVTEEIKGETKIFLETNDNENMMTQNLWDAAKAVLRRKFIEILS